MPSPRQIFKRPKILLYANLCRGEGTPTYGGNMTTHLKALQLKARHQVYTLLSGHNLSKLHGEGYDFSELREYQMGDDIRKINWMHLTSKRPQALKKLRFWSLKTEFFSFVFH